MAFPDNTKEPGNVLQTKYTVAADNTKVQIGVAGKMNIYGYTLENNHSAAVFLQLFNVASTAAVTLGTTVADWTITLPASAAVQLPPIRALRHFNLGCVMAVTSTRGGAAAPGAAATVSIYFSQS